MDDYFSIFFLISDINSYFFKLLFLFFSITLSSFDCSIDTTLGEGYFHFVNHIKCEGDEKGHNSMKKKKKKKKMPQRRFLPIHYQNFPE